VPRFSCTTISLAFLCYSLTASLCSWPYSFIIFSETRALGFSPSSQGPHRSATSDSLHGGFRVFVVSLRPALLLFRRGSCKRSSGSFSTRYTNTSNHAAISPVPTSTRTGYLFCGPSSIPPSISSFHASLTLQCIDYFLYLHSAISPKYIPIWFHGCLYLIVIFSSSHYEINEIYCMHSWRAPVLDSSCV